MFGVFGVRKKGHQLFWKKILRPLTKILATLLHVPYLCRKSTPPARFPNVVLDYQIFFPTPKNSLYDSVTAPHNVVGSLQAINVLLQWTHDVFMTVGHPPHTSPPRRLRRLDARLWRNCVLLALGRISTFTTA